MLLDKEYVTQTKYQLAELKGKDFRRAVEKLNMVSCICTPDILFNTYCQEKVSKCYHS